MKVIHKFTNSQTQDIWHVNELNLLGSAVVSGGSSEVDVLVGSIAMDVAGSEGSANEMENSMYDDDDDDDQHFAYASVVVPRTYLSDHYHVPYLNSK